MTNTRWIAAVALTAITWAVTAVAGTRLTGWFTENFALAELKALRAKERIPQLRPGNGRYPSPTLHEVIDIGPGWWCTRTLSATRTPSCPRTSGPRRTRLHTVTPQPNTRCTSVSGWTGCSPTIRMPRWPPALY